jgi:hypothetical protein
MLDNDIPIVPVLLLGSRLLLRVPYRMHTTPAMLSFTYFININNNNPERVPRRLCRRHYFPVAKGLAQLVTDDITPATIQVKQKCSAIAIAITVRATDNQLFTIYSDPNYLVNRAGCDVNQQIVGV